MSTNELEHQPAVAVENREMETSSEHAIPDVKSGVHLDSNANVIAPSPKFRDGDRVHMSELIGTRRVRGTYQVYASRYSRSKGYTEYQLLVPLTQTLHNKGAWFREKELRMDSRG
ncbi:hypothetical protein IQ06DRAFT_294321 [Phaeosphaeriaceae sp. SRC1lsM3a]|nr:hypothetical protein IQ06DRAFT_294321 [Stagonospora sp. SRC1lsM3a]